MGGRTALNSAKYTSIRQIFNSLSGGGGVWFPTYRKHRKATEQCRYTSNREASSGECIDSVAETGAWPSSGTLSR